VSIIIGLLGPAGAGKSTVAGHLEKRYGAKRYSLAWPLKEIAARTLQFTYEQLFGTQEQKEAVDPRYGFSARWFLQRLGTEGCRAVLGEDVWTRACLDKIYREKPTIAVVEDVRFVNEAAAIQHPTCAGYVWRLNPPDDAVAVARVEGAGSHSSESEWRLASADLEVRPRARGIPELLELADDAAKSCHLIPLRREIPL
jgi:hypothetical protein